MPGYLFHLAFGEEVLKKGGIGNKESFKLGNLSPDLAQNKLASHFKTLSNSAFLVPNLTEFIQKYAKEIKENDFVKGYYAHLFLDYHFISDFVTQHIITLDWRMQQTSVPSQIKFIKLRRNNKYIDLEDNSPIEIDSFFREKILRREYTALNRFLKNDYVLSLPQPTNIPNCITEVPAKTIIHNYTELNQELAEILLSSDESSSVFSYEDYKTFSKSLASKFAESLRDLL